MSRRTHTWLGALGFLPSGCWDLEEGVENYLWNKLETSDPGYILFFFFKFQNNTSISLKVFYICLRFLQYWPYIPKWQAWICIHENWATEKCFLTSSVNIHHNCSMCLSQGLIAEFLNFMDWVLDVIISLFNTTVHWWPKKKLAC